MEELKTQLKRIEEEQARQKRIKELRERERLLIEETQRLSATLTGLGDTTGGAASAFEGMAALSKKPRRGFRGPSKPLTKAQKAARKKKRKQARKSRCKS